MTLLTRRWFFLPSLAGMRLVLTLLAAMGAFSRSGFGQDRAALRLQYEVRIARPTTHLAEVEITVAPAPEPGLDFVMPAWSPGRYAIYDFAKNVQEFEARGAQGQPLPWTNTDKETWRVSTAGAGGALRVRYKVFANDLNGTFSQVDASHANLNGASIYMYVAGHKHDPLTLTVAVPAGWKVISGFSLSARDRTFPVANYDRLIDTPLEMTPDPSMAWFSGGGKTFRVVVHSYGDDPETRAQRVNELAADLKKIVDSEMAMMPAPDFDHYTFLLHFEPDISAGDGMEHLNSSQIIVRGTWGGGALREALEDAAHEFFHAWNVKRLRPAALGPFNYTREAYTRSLWFAEGVTQYYSYVHMLRSGLWDRRQFLDRLASEIRQLEGDPGRALMSAESSSFHAWFYDRAPQMQETNFANTTISYYNKGALLGLLLDLEIRARTRGEKSLDDVVRLMYRNFYQSGAATYYLSGRGYRERDILNALNAVTGTDFESFFRQYVAGTVPLPYDQVLALAGLHLTIGTRPGEPPSLDAITRPEDMGVRIVAVRPGGAADRAGLSRDDLLIAVDEFSLATESLAERLRIYPPGAEVPFTVQRHGERERITVQLDPPEPNEYSIRESPLATPEQVRIREGWLGSGQP